MTSRAGGDKGKRVKCVYILDLVTSVKIKQYL